MLHLPVNQCCDVLVRWLFLTPTPAAHARRRGAPFQGAFYVLGEKIVQHLARSRDLLTVMSVEDAMVGIWLLGIDKVRPYVFCSRFFFFFSSSRLLSSSTRRRLNPQRPSGPTLRLRLKRLRLSRCHMCHHYHSSPPGMRLFYYSTTLLSPD